MVFIVFVVVEEVAARRIIILSFISNFVSAVLRRNKGAPCELAIKFLLLLLYYLCFIIHHLEL